ncbi:MAG: hypothetical protein COV07_01180 [Candidatus Vogelbacteria bacterium CG10_big_fil_rev_8_21_14_0_10_45_14]|uniref:Metallo-beta-lactamase domain-containing protein n=1 Tax=Candidatus Vogelbacteria bacterium CG10_big_fil_rev_8_21_14_0_10_45_14 TaxID=1975042 RepID=A0A2H0RKR2_9BACT|nr:MAG: hypothetical protein COV07_01180 [Candidatus Vogelbacteria bacterium CG10_big_fil_rev_8_21_14_0_10_45_14]
MKHWEKVLRRRILFDPGAWSVVPEDTRNLDAIVVAHEHQDHYEIDLLKRLLGASSGAQVITNSGVGKHLDDVGIRWQKIEDGQSTRIKGVEIRGEGSEHALIHKEWNAVHNTGYIIADSLFHPGDSFNTVPSPKVEFLALPVSAPWGTIGVTIDFARAVGAKKCFAIHDANLRWPGSAHVIPKELLAKDDIEFFVPEDGREYEL